MANTLCKVQVQFVFVVKYRMALIHESWEEELYKYITGIIENRKHKMLAINGMPDHLHILVGIRPHESLSDLAREVKKRLRTSSMNVNSPVSNSSCRKDLVLSLTPNRKSKPWSAIFLTRRNITGK